MSIVCPTCREVQVRKQTEECRNCYTESLKEFSEQLLGRDVQFTPQWTNEDLTSGQIY
jgi:hypothetical protein